MKDIFKLQRPITSNNPDLHILVYNQDRSAMFELSIGEDGEAWMEKFGSRLKIYAECNYGATADDFEFLKEVPKQKW